MKMFLVVPRSPKANYERSGSPKLDKPTSSNSVKKHFWKCVGRTIKF